MPVTIETTIPVLAVADVAASVAFYRDRLGFAVDWGGDEATPDIASVSRDGHAIMLQRAAPAPATVWIGLDGLEVLYRALREAGVAVAQPPTNQPWALEMRVRDPDGHVLWFGTGARDDTLFGQQPDGL